MLAEIFAPSFVGSEICRFGLNDRPPHLSIPFFAVKKKKKQISHELIRLYKFILPEKPHPQGCVWTLDFTLNGVSNWPFKRSIVFGFIFFFSLYEMNKTDWKFIGSYFYSVLFILLNSYCQIKATSSKHGELTKTCVSEPLISKCRLTPAHRTYREGATKSRGHWANPSTNFGRRYREKSIVACIYACTA